VIDTRYFISSAACDIDRLAAARGHRGVESMHWLLDIEFKDDLSRYRISHGAKNMRCPRGPMWYRSLFRTSSGLLRSIESCGFRNLNATPAADAERVEAPDDIDMTARRRHRCGAWCMPALTPPTQSWRERQS
jgi:hypothetical protein